MNIFASREQPAPFTELEALFRIPRTSLANAMNPTLCTQTHFCHLCSQSAFLLFSFPLQFRVEQITFSCGRDVVACIQCEYLSSSETPLSTTGRDLIFTYHTRRDTQMLCPDLREARLATAPLRNCQIIWLSVDSLVMYDTGAREEERTESDAEVKNNASPKRLVGYVSY